MSKWFRYLCLSGLFALLSCQSTPPDRASASQTGPVEYSTAHLPLEKWKRTPECCTAEGKTFAIASGSNNTARAGYEMQERGCSLVDSAIAVSFALAVEKPQSTGLGGGGFMTLHLKKKKGTTIEFIDFRETAPRTARADMFLKDGKPVPGLSEDGVHAAGTPGFVAGMFELYEKHGSKKAKCKWSDLLQPAIKLAEEGISVTYGMSERIGIRQKELEKDPLAKALLLKDGKPLAVGDKLVQTDLGKTLRIIAKTGKTDFYRGKIAKQIAEYIKANAVAGVPFVDATDLKNYRVRTMKPLRGTFQGFEILTAPPPSAGGVTMLESLNILSGFDLKALPSKKAYVHLLSETLLRAFADRTIIGDNVPGYERLLTKEYADSVRPTLNLEHPTPAKNIKPALPVVEKPHTTHASLMDNQGNAIAITQTVNFFFGAARMVPGTGIFLNDEMDDFSKSANTANLSGLPDANANAVGPNKRPVSSMVPTIVLKDKTPVLAIGAAGSSTIVSGVMQTILNDLVFWPYDLHKALFAERMHKQYNPAKDVLSLENDGFGLATQSALKEMGHDVKPAPFVAITQAVGFNPSTTNYTAVHDPRDEGSALAK